MSDSFEEEVRQAAQGLAGAAAASPTYHEAWHRGRRRRAFKRTGLAAAAALVLVAALGVNTGRFPGSNSAETDDIAIDAAAVATPTTVATTPPVTQESTGSAAAAAEEAPTNTEAADSAAAAIESAPAPGEEPADEPEAVAPTVPAAAATVAPPPTAPPTPVTPVPTTDPAPTPEPTVTPDPSPTTAFVVPTEVPDDSESTTTDNSTDRIPEDGTPGDGAATTTGPAELPPATATGPAPDRPADATLLSGITQGFFDPPCDTDGDERADATCELLVDYPCAGAAEARPGYEAVDADDDGTVETCTAVNVTRCDTTSDGQGDTPCIIELLPQHDVAPQPTVGGEDETE